MNNKKYFPVILIITLYCGILAGNAHAAWSNNSAVNNAISTIASTAQYPSITSDGSGGAIVTWQDDRSGNWVVYAQKVDVNGVVQWSTGGVVISTEAVDQQVPTIISDGSGGAIITWFDLNDDIFAQRINASGAVQWATAGVPLVTAEGTQNYPTITSDGSGGAIITWNDFRNGPLDIYAQRLDSSGVVQWAADGVAIVTAQDYQAYPNITSDGSGGAIITWYDYRSGNWDVYAQKIDGSGLVQWAADGVPITTLPSAQYMPTITSDGSGGAIITWDDYRNGNHDIYAQRIGGSGVVQWTTDGVAICTETDDQQFPTITGDGNGGAIITWQDDRSGNWDIYAQSIDGSGVVQWATDGVPISTAANDQLLPTITSINGYPNANTVAKANANTVAKANAKTVAKANANLNTNSGGAIITWQDNRNGTPEIYSQLVNVNGVLGAVPTTIPVPASVPVPAMDEWARILLLGMLGLSAAFTLRCRQ